jgi:hypothetical protein
MIATLYADFFAPRNSTHNPKLTTLSQVYFSYNTRPTVGIFDPKSQCHTLDSPGGPHIVNLRRLIVTTPLYLLSYTEHCVLLKYIHIQYERACTS